MAPMAFRGYTCNRDPCIERSEFGCVQVNLLGLSGSSGRPPYWRDARAAPVVGCKPRASSFIGGFLKTDSQHTTQFGISDLMNENQVFSDPTAGKACHQ